MSLFLRGDYLNLRLSNIPAMTVTEVLEKCDRSLDDKLFEVMN